MAASPFDRISNAMRIAALVLAALLLLAQAAAAEPRVALVIGNSSYGGDLGNLPNPVNDAKLMAKTLRGIGFDVVEAEDADQAKMKRAIQDFGARLAQSGGGATGLFFYAGHGLQVAGTNYLIPIRARIAREPDVDIEAIAVDLVMKQMAFADSAVNIVILDACRNNPLSRGFRTVSRGLADPSVRPMGSFVAYSTAPGDVAEDGKGANSPYTTALAEAITKPGASINDVFQAVRGKVLAATSGKQVPWDSSSLTAPFYFVPAAVAPPAAGTTGPEAMELAFWDTIKDSKSAEDYQAYLTQYPDGAFVPLAEIRLKQADRATTRVVHQTPEPAPAAETGEQMASMVETAFWDGARSDDAVAGYQAYLAKFPKGQFVTQAQKRMAELSAPAAPPPQPETSTESSRTPPPAPALPTIADATAKLYARDQARVRGAPTTESDILDKLAADTPLEATGRSGDGVWWRVRLPEGRIGFVAASVVRDQPSAQPAVATTATTAKPAGNDSDLCNSDKTPAEQRADACRRWLAAGIDDANDRYNAHIYLGSALYDLNRYDDAMPEFRAAADLDPNFYGAFYMMGRVYLDQSRYAEARSAFDKAVRLDPSRSYPIMYRGKAARRLGDFTAALADLKRAIAMNADDTDSYDEITYLHLVKSDLAAAASDVDKALALDPQYWSASGIFALFLSGRQDAALAMASRATAGEPGFFYWWIWKAMVQRAQGDMSAASATLAQGRAAHGETDWPLTLGGYIEGKIAESEIRRLGAKGDSKTQAERLCEIEFYTGMLKAEAGDKSAAVAALRRSTNSRIYYYIEYMVAPAWITALNQ